MTRVALLAAVLCCALPAPAGAERRLFAHSYQYGTEPPGDTTVALWHQESRARWKSSRALLDFTLEVEHGITEHWDAALMATFAQLSHPDPTRAEPFGLDRVMLQNRYRFADRSEWPADVQVQLELGKDFGPSIYDLGLRAVIARDLDKLSVAANVVAVVTAGNDTDSTLALPWSAGASYELHPRVNVGLEAFGRLDERVLALGPGLAVEPSPRLWLAVTAAAGLTELTDELIVRALLGLEL